MDIKKALRQKMENLQRSGIHVIPKIAAAAPAKKTHSKGPARATSHSAAPQLAPSKTEVVSRTCFAETTVAKGRNMTKNEKVASLTILDQQVKSCTLCSELVDNRTQTVFGVGNPEARLCFFGEAPGADEDAQGEPFVGRAGQLLTKIIEACTFKRDDVYILNVLKCRPPGNRNPTPDEASHCRTFFEQQLEIINPEFIVCLGSIAATTLLETKLSIGKLRGTFHQYKQAKVVATYHPAYLLRNPPAKKYVWEDMKMLLKEMGIKIPQ